MTYDHWLATNPLDEYLGPLPDEEYEPRIEVASGGPDLLNAFLDEGFVGFASRSRVSICWHVYRRDDDEDRFLGFTRSKEEARARLTDLAEEIAEGRM